MDPMQIVLVILVLAGVWAVVELALVLRRTRGVIASLDKTVEQVASTIEEARPVVAKLDGVVDELQPAVAQIEPLLKQATVAVEALSADLVEVNGVLRDVSAVSGAASSASNAVTGIVDGATEKVHKLFAKPRKAEPAPASPVPVSYTHLDVYKRQVHDGHRAQAHSLPAKMAHRHQPVHVPHLHVHLHPVDGRGALPQGRLGAHAARRERHPR